MLTLEEWREKLLIHDWCRREIVRQYGYDNEMLRAFDKYYPAPEAHVKES